MTEQTIQEGKTLAIVSYLTIIGSVIAIFLNKEKPNEFTTFHNKQGLGLCLTYMIVGYFVSQFDSDLISMSFWICFGVLFLYGIYGAITGKLYLVPALGTYYQKWFKNII